jgi:signal transduction histidine kinase
MLARLNPFYWYPTYQPAVEHELFVLGYRNLLVHGIGQLILSSIVGVGSWGFAPHSTILFWGAWVLLSLLVVLAGLWFFSLQVKSTVALASNLAQWRVYHFVAVFFIGIGWGAVGFLLVPAESVHNLMLVVSFAGVLAYSAVSNAPHDPFAFCVSALFAVLLLSTQIFRAFADEGYFLFAMSSIYVAALGLATRNARATLLASIELRLANEELAKSNALQAARAEQANRDKSEFLAAASHDLRQPVHALLLLIEAYRQQEPTATNHPLMQHISAAGQSISSLFNALMELSRLESGKDKPALARFGMMEVVNRVLARTRPEAAGKGLSVRCYVAKSLPSKTLFSDKFMLERILGNLLSNAVRYTEQGGILLSIRAARPYATHPLAAGAVGFAGGIALEVRDTGIGIAPSDQGRVFQPYVQIGNRERDRSKGLGLGLAIVQHTSSLLGMGITVRSVQGKGSAFTLHIPASATMPDPTDLRLAASGVPPVVCAPFLAKRRILLVEDDPMVRQSMQALLGGWQMDLRCATRGDSSVLDVCGADWIPECVLSDFRLPGSMHGIAVLDMLIERFPNAVGILQTGELAQAVQTLAEEAGYLVLFKPVDADVLASTLSAVLQARN